MMRLSLATRCMRPAWALSVLAALLLSGCTDALQDAAAGRGTGALGYLLFCANFNVCF